MGLLSLFQVKNRHEAGAEKLRPVVGAVKVLEEKYKAMSDVELQQSVMEHKGKSAAELEPLIPELFAAIREGGNRILKMRLFDVQLMGGLALLKNNISEMKTGEGKTFVATLPLIVRALSGKGAHLVTVNDYLAGRDANWMKPLYEFFGLTVGVVIPNMSPAQKREAYAADITYGTNNEFGFDYLRDNMAGRAQDLTQRDLYYAIVDEVDSILIDEARTPLIISAPDAESTSLYEQFSRLVPSLKEDVDYNVDEKRKAATLTDTGVSKVEELLTIENIYEEKGIRFVHHLEQALRAHTLYHRDKDYVVQEGQVIIVDEFTGRLMQGRRYSEGLHQALEAKEKVPVQQESRTLASITFQNYFRLYKHLAGMTGTAVTSAEEFEKVYNLDVVVIPTNRALTRQDKTDRIFINEAAKFKAVVEQIKERHQKGQPVLVGTIAIEKSEYLSSLLNREGVPHKVLNAKQHAQEAEIVANAGQKGAVTISTNMAGRGTDIKLGEGVAAVGGLFVLGTERHEARRIDNQLRGRSGRQGDAGETQFFVSMEDDIMRVFGGNRMKSLMERLNIPENEPIENRLVSKALEGAQERVEGYYFDMRKQVLSYDDVMNRQRNAIYTLRRALLLKGQWKEGTAEAQDLDAHMQSLLQEQVTSLTSAHTAAERIVDWNIEEIAESVQAITGQELAAIHQTLDEVVAKNSADGPEGAKAALEEKVGELLHEKLEAKKSQMGEAAFFDLEKAAALRAIDLHWMDHLDTMDYLRTGIGLRGYGQRDPLVEYQKEGRRLFLELMTTIKASFIDVVFKAEIIKNEAERGEARHEEVTAPHRITGPAEGNPAPVSPQTKPQQNDKPLVNEYKNVGRNDLCPCGSGKKFKKCHGK